MLLLKLEIQKQKYPDKKNHFQMILKCLFRIFLF